MDMFKVVDELMAKMFGEMLTKPEEKEAIGITDLAKFLTAIEEEDEDE